MIIIVAFISFLLGFFIQLIALPFILKHLAKGVWVYVNNISSTSIFRWSVSLIVSFALSALIIQNQRERVLTQTSSNYQHIVDSLNLEIKMLQQHNVK